MASLAFPVKPNQPKLLSFPNRSFGKKNVVQRAFRPSWFDKWKWIHYDETADAAFCHVRTKAEEEGKLKASSKDLVFLQKGFNWKDATEGFRRHELSKCHQDAIQVMTILPRSVHDVGESLSSAHVQNKTENQRVLLKILQSVKFLGRQGIAFCGHDEQRATSCSSSIFGGGGGQSRAECLVEEGNRQVPEPR